MTKITWETISYKQFKRMEPILEQKITTDNLIKLLEIIHNKPKDYFENLPLKELEKQFESLDILNSDIPQLKENRIINIGNKLFGLIDLQNISYTEYELCKTYLTNKDYAGIQSILYREITNISLFTRAYLKYINKLKSQKVNYKLKKFTYEDSLINKELFENQNIIIPYNTSLFFCLLTMNYMNNSKTFSKVQEIVQQQMDYQKSGDQS